MNCNAARFDFRISGKTRHIFNMIRFEPRFLLLHFSRRRNSPAVILSYAIMNILILPFRRTKPQAFSRLAHGASALVGVSQN